MNPKTENYVVGSHDFFKTLKPFICPEQLLSDIGGKLLYAIYVVFREKSKPF